MSRSCNGQELKLPYEVPCKEATDALRDIEKQHEVKVRNLVVKRDTKRKHLFLLCDEETGYPLAGQVALKLENHNDSTPKLTVTFEAFGTDGIRFEDEPRK